MTYLIVEQGSASFEEFVQNNVVDENKILFIRDRGFSVSRQINLLIQGGSEDFVVIASSDLVLPDRWLEKAPELFGEVVSRWPSCTAITAVGLGVFQHGYAATHRIDHLIEGGYQGLASPELPVTSSSPEFVLLDLEKLRHSFPVGFTEHPNEDFHLWFCLELAVYGLSVIASPAMAAFLPNGFRKSQTMARPNKATMDFVSRHINSKSIVTTRGKFNVPLNHDADLRRFPPSADALFLGSLSNNSPDPTLTIVTRTQFKRISELSRCLESVLSFASHYGEQNLNLVLVADCHPPSGFEIPQGFELVIATVPPKKDSRFLLVGEAVSRVESDYYLFVDDDDWMFPNNASALRGILGVCPPDSVLFSDARHYLEDRGSDESLFVGNKITNGRFFPGGRFMGSLSGVNNSPFCSVVFPRKTFEGLDPNVYSSIEYAEDYFLILKTLYQDSVPFVFDGQLVGVSIRESGNTVTEFGHVKWLRAKANVAHNLATIPGISKGKFVQMFHSSNGRSSFLLARIWRTLFDGRLWRIAVQYNIIMKILKGQISLKYAASKLVGLIKQGW